MNGCFSSIEGLEKPLLMMMEVKMATVMMTTMIISRHSNWYSCCPSCIVLATVFMQTLRKEPQPSTPGSALGPFPRSSLTWWCCSWGTQGHCHLLTKTSLSTTICSLSSTHLVTPKGGSLSISSPVTWVDCPEILPAKASLSVAAMQVQRSSTYACPTWSWTSLQGLNLPTRIWALAYLVGHWRESCQLDRAGRAM